MLCESRVKLQDDLEELHRLMAATLHLMTAYSASAQGGRACPLLAEVISRHLTEISRAADCDPILRATSVDLHDRWKLRADVPPACPRRPWWLRVVDGPAS